jgi:hypothetical protein
MAISVPAVALALVNPAAARGHRASQASQAADVVETGVRVLSTAVGQASAGPLSAGPLALPEPNTLVLALVGTDGPTGTGRQLVSGITGGGLSWQRAVSGPGTAGNAEIWYAMATQPIQDLRVSVRRALANYHGFLELASVAGADPAAPVAAVGRAAGHDSAPVAALTPRSPGSLLFAVGNAFDTASQPAPAAGQRLLGSLVDKATGDTFWATTVTAATAGLANLGLTAPNTGRWTAVAAAVQPVGGSPELPTGGLSTILPVPPNLTPKLPALPKLPKALPKLPKIPTTLPSVGTPPLPGTGAWPGPSNTGVPIGTKLTPSRGIRVDKAGTVLQNLDIAGQVEIHAANVTIRNCRIASDSEFGVRVVAGNVTIVDSEITGSSAAAIAFDNWAAYRVNIHGVHADGVKFGSHTVLQDSWIHDFAPAAGSHSDGGQMEGGVSDLTIRHNTINVPGGNAALFMSPDLGPNGAGPVLIDHNLLGGGGWTVYLTDGHGSHHQLGYTVTNNHWLHNAQYGPLALNEPATSFLAWSGNLLDALGTTIPAP